MDDTDAFTLSQSRVSSGRPLLGLTVLAVEDSSYAAEALRLMCLRSGARIRRADCLKSARHHLCVYKPTVLITDLGLPDGSGADLIEELATASPRIAVILGMSGDSFAEDTAIAAGADGFLAKPLTSLPRFQDEILRRLSPDFRLAAANPVGDEAILPDPLAYRDDMALVADILSEGNEGKALDYVAQFLRGVARSAGDGTLAKAAEELAQARMRGQPLASPTARIAGLVQQRLREAPRL